MKRNGRSGGARTQRADYAQLSIVLQVKHTDWNGEMAENAWQRPFETRVGRKVAGRTSLSYSEDMVSPPRNCTFDSMLVVQYFLYIQK